MKPVMLWDKLLRELLCSCTHIVALDEQGHRVASAAITERFYDGMPAPGKIRMEVWQIAKPGPVDIYLFRGAEAVIPVSLDWRMHVGPGDTIDLAFRGCFVSEG
jgi:hypothetical protein